MIQVEKDVPLPERAARGSKYPFGGLLSVGDSFVAPGVSARTLYGTARVWARKEKNGWQFIVRPVKGGARIWRKA